MIEGDIFVVFFIYFAVTTNEIHVHFIGNNIDTSRVHYLVRLDVRRLFGEQYDISTRDGTWTYTNTREYTFIPVTLTAQVYDVHCTWTMYVNNVRGQCTTYIARICTIMLYNIRYTLYIFYIVYTVYCKLYSIPY